MTTSRRWRFRAASNARRIGLSHQRPRRAPARRADLLCRRRLGASSAAFVRQGQISCSSARNRCSGAPSWKKPPALLACISAVTKPNCACAPPRPIYPPRHVIAKWKANCKLKRQARRPRAIAISPAIFAAPKRWRIICAGRLRNFARAPPKKRWPQHRPWSRLARKPPLTLPPRRRMPRPRCRRCARRGGACGRLHRLILEREALDAEEARAREIAQTLRQRIAQTAQDFEREQTLHRDAETAQGALGSEANELEAAQERAATISLRRMLWPRN